MGELNMALRPQGVEKMPLADLVRLGEQRLVEEQVIY